MTERGGGREKEEERRDRKSNQDLESGLVFVELERERIISLVQQQATGANQSYDPCLHKGLHSSNQVALISALFDCVLTYQQGFSSEGQEKSFFAGTCLGSSPKFSSKGEKGREGGGLKRTPTWTFLSI
jgi:hypothetical protein